MLHEIADLKRFIGEIKHILKNPGKLVIIEWNKVPGNWGPPVEERLDSNILIELLSNEGFAINSQTDIGGNFYSIVAIYDRIEISE